MPVAGQSAAVKTKSNAQLTRSVNALSKGVKSFGAAIAKLRTDQASTTTKLQGVLDGVPTIVSALTQLKDGLTTVGTAFQAVEYGGIAGTVTLDAAAGGTTTATPALVSSDIPDDGNPATLSAQFPIDLSAIPTGAVGATVRLKAAIRSNESDGKAGSNDPAGQVGALLYAQCVRPQGCGEIRNPANGTVVQAATPPGSLICTPTQTPAQNFSIPDGTTRSLNLINIPTASSRTSSAPDVNSPDSGASPCRLPGNGSYILFVNAQFVDIPTSLKPGPTD